jgi:hypothetical protein
MKGKQNWQWCGEAGKCIARIQSIPLSELVVEKKFKEVFNRLEELKAKKAVIENGEK